MRNILLEIQYDGTEFNGWQVQPKGRTVEGEITKVLKKLTNEDIKLIASGRTDSKVHAKGQVANFKTSSNIPIDRFSLALNSNLSDDIIIKSAKEVSLDFNSRYDAVNKIYSYYIYNDKIPNCFLRNYAYLVKDTKIDITKLNEAKKILEGEHDFRAFMSSGSSVENTVRKIYYIDISKDNDIIKVEIKGNGFLYNMVRIIVGTLIDYNKGKISLEEIKEAIKTGNRSLLGHTAPGNGLYLYKVNY